MHDQEELDRTLHDLRNRYKAQGLKSLQFLARKAPGEHNKLLVEASPIEEIVLDAPIEEVVTLAMTMQTRTPSTVLYVSFDGDKRFNGGRPFRNGPGGHAERKFEDRIPQLLIEIDRSRRRGELNTPPGQPVPVILDMNRAPCDHCAPRVLSLLEQNRERLSVQINAASMWQQGLGTMSLTSDKTIRSLLDERCSHKGAPHLAANREADTGIWCQGGPREGTSVRYRCVAESTFWNLWQRRIRSGRSAGAG